MRKKWTYTLMTVSLVLLAIFLGYWLKDSYLRTKRVMQEKNTLLFSQAVRKAEDSLLVWRFNFPEISSGKGDTMVQIFIELDSVEMNAFSSGNDLHEIKPEGESRKAFGIRKEFSFARSQGGDPRMENELVSSASVIVHAIRGTDMDTARIDTFLFSQIEQNYKMAKDAAFPGIGYGMIRLNDSVRAGTAQWMTPIFRDPVGKVRYAAVLDAGFWDVFRSILPQFLFSLFLLWITVAAFWVIHRHLRQQVQLANLKDDFISNMTHELKTPISTVHVALEAMENFNVLEDREKTREYLNISKNEIQRLRLLVDQVMQHTALQSGDFRMQKERVDINELTRNVISAFQVILEQKQMQIDFEPAGEAVVHADPLHLSNVMFNLVDNAVKYGHQGQCIRIRVEQANGYVSWSIQDEGRGIGKDELPHIFEKFYRVPQGNVHNVKGHGLGLYYVDRIVHLHNGKIRVKSSKEEGTQFTITLPEQK